MKDIIKLTTFPFLIFAGILYSCKKQEVPTLTTSALTNITGTTATSGGTITTEGSGTIIARGVCWSQAITPTIADNKTTDGAGAGAFTSNMSGLNGATAYYVRAYATNNAGMGYGIAMSFTTLGQAPTATTQSATNVTSNSATLNGLVNANYLSTVVSFEYGTTISYGQTMTATQSPVTSNSNTNVTAEITGLTPGTAYHFRVKTVNSLGTTNGNDLSFTTLGQAPNAVTQLACCLSSTGAKLNGTVNANYVSTTVTFEYSTTTAYGNSVAASPSPVAGNTNTNVSANISGLIVGTNYHFRIKAVNSLGTTLGNDMEFTTILADIDGNIYNQVTIGTQIWMKENLKTTKYSNGDAMPNVTDGAQWSSLTTGGCCNYNSKSNIVVTYGRLYNWYAISDNRNLCPTGWHVPTDAEWTTLITYLGGESIAGDKLKESGTTHWMSPNAATDTSGFTALPGGYRYADGTAFDVITITGLWWSATEYNASNVWIRLLDYNSSFVRKDFINKNVGLSVRCLKD